MERTETCQARFKKNWKEKMATSLNTPDEFLLTVMQLRLGLLNEYVADHFNTSTTKSSFIFKTCIKLLRKLLKNLFACLSREAIRDNLPEAFIKTGNNKYRVIIDYAEVSIKKTKPLDCQDETWSDYKHHNAIKFLRGSSPLGFITFLSSCYGGINQ